MACTARIRKSSIHHRFPGGKADLYAAVAVRYIEATSERTHCALTGGARLTDRLVALTMVSAEHSGAISFEQRIYDALDHVGTMRSGSSRSSSTAPGRVSTPSGSRPGASWRGGVPCVPEGDPGHTGM